MKGRKNVHLVQASIYELPFRREVFDGCYSIGVIQHTPDPKKAISSLPWFIKKDGKIALTIYELKSLTKLNSKYLVRPIVKKMNKTVLLSAIKVLMPFLFLLTEILFRLPFMGRLFRFIIPVANYVDESKLSFGERYRWAVLDTFDMLSPAYDYPQAEEDVRKALSEAGIIEIHRLDNSGLNLVGRKWKKDLFL
jgi:ubiquinone/menaquinone biosynthesis C-methylase UbiE